MADLENCRLPWYKRGSSSFGYSVQLGVWFTLFFWVLMVVPYSYDQLNRKIYDAAMSEGILVIREFQVGTTADAERKTCAALQQARSCDERQIFERISKKRIIALDYVDRLEDATKLTFSDFARNVSISYLLALFLVILLSRFPKWTSFKRFSALTLLFLGVIAYVGIFLDLPHKNTKFYFVVGVIYAVLLPVMDYLHRTPAFNLDVLNTAKSHKAIAQMLKLSHKRWSQVLGVALAIVIALTGTVSFKIIDYQTATFGESFIYYPLLGMITAGIVGLAGFLWGVLRPILVMLVEIEEYIGSLILPDKTASPSP